MVQILQITQDTVIKRRPLQSSQLPPDEVVRIPKGITFELHSYAYADADGDFDDHIKFAIGKQEEYIRGISTWYVYELHAQVLEDGKVVYPIEEKETSQVLKIIENTSFKGRPISSSELAANEKFNVPKGAKFDIESYAYADATGEFSNHIKFALEKAEDFINGKNTWYVYDQHAQVLFDDVVVYPQPKTVTLTIPTPSPAPTPRPTPVPTPSPQLGQPLRLPGFASTFYMNQPIVPGGSFTWAEATKNGTRIPTSKRIVNNIVMLAKALERPRKQLGRPFRVTSWYRDPASNARAGGARGSQHLFGKAIDFQVIGYSARQAARELDWWPGGLGSYPSWIHLDIGPRRRWRY